jgi:hypothetical protein
LEAYAVNRHTYDLHVYGVDAHDLPLGFLRDVCDLVLEGVQRSLRLVLEGRSTGVGPIPRRIADLSDVHVAAYQRGSLELVLSAPTLGEAGAATSQQALFGESLAPETTALDLFLRAADDAVSGKQDSERLDAGLLEVLARTQG